MLKGSGSEFDYVGNLDRGTDIGITSSTSPHNNMFDISLFHPHQLTCAREDSTLWNNVHSFVVPDGCTNPQNPKLALILLQTKVSFLFDDHR